MKMLKYLGCIALLSVAAHAQVAISASSVKDSFEVPLPVARLCFTPVNAALTPSGFRVGSVQVIPNEVCGKITTGVLQTGLTLAPSATGLYYHIYVKASNSNTILRDFGMTPITGSSWSLDNYDPAISSVPATALTMGTVTTLPAGSGGSCSLSGANPTLLNCSVPQGVQGPPGTTTATGTSGDFIVPGKLTAQSTNIAVLADQQTGIDASVKINTCITAAIAAHVPCDASGLGGTQTVSQQINVGDVGGDAVQLVLPDTGEWTITISDGVSCAIKQYQNTRIHGRSRGSGSAGQILSIETASTANITNGYCPSTSWSPGAQGYMEASGFALFNRNATATVSNALMFVAGLFDNSIYDNIGVYNYYSVGLKIEGACCGVTFRNITAGGNSTSVGDVVQIVADAGVANVYNMGISFDNLSATHPGPGYAAVDVETLNVTGTTTATNKNINFYNLYTECSTTGTMYGLKVMDARGVHVYGFTGGENTNSGCTESYLGQTTANQLRDVLIESYSFENTNGLALNDSISGITECPSTCYIPKYYYGGMTGTAPSAQVAKPVVMVDTELDLYNAAGVLKTKIDNSGNITNTGNLTNTGLAVVDSANSSTASSITIRKGGDTTQQYLVSIDSGGSLRVTKQDGSNMITINQSGAFVISSFGSNPIQFQNSTTASTNGVAFWSGGASTHLVSNVDTNGNIFFGGVGTGGSYSTGSGKFTGTFSGQRIFTFPDTTGGVVLTNGSTPANNATCIAGQQWFDASFLYICTASGTVKRVALSTF